jgi:formate hydrogenlyase subunit 4
MTAATWVALGLTLVAAPALPGIVNRTRSLLTGRRGAPVTQLYRDLARLWRKGTIYSRTTTWVFRIAPILLLATTAAAACLLPLDGRSALLTFAGDFVAFAGLLALGRFALVLAALDTGSSFEGMGASREGTFGSMGEPALVLCFAALALATGGTSLALMFSEAPSLWSADGPALAMVAGALLLLTIAETGRVPVDDPATHLELTMIHEVMVLDHSGPDLAIVQYATALKLALFGTMIVDVLVPRAGLPVAASLAVWLVALGAVAVALGVVEAMMARMSLARVPRFLVAAGILPAFAIILLLGSAG